MEELKPKEAEALDIIESLLDVADMKCTGPLYADDPPRSGMCRIPEEDAAKLRKYIADCRDAPENKPQWISTSERLPNPIPARLLVTNGKIVCETSGEVLVFCHENFTHWMTLPKPPEEQSHLCKTDGEIRSVKDGINESECGGVAKLLLDAPKSQPKMWISISEKRPSNTDNVLTCDSKGNIHIMYDSLGFKYPFNIGPHHSRYWPVKYWMPLPVPPQEATT